MAKAAFLNDPDGRSQLGLAGVEPVPLNNLIGAIEALIERGAKPEYAARLAKKAVTPAKLADLAAKLAALKAADQAQEEAKRAAPLATAARNAAAQELAAWVREFKAFAKAQFSDRPDLLKRWGLK